MSRVGEIGGRPRGTTKPRTRTREGKIGELVIEHVRTGEMRESVWTEVRALCDAAYAEDTMPYFEAIGPGEHLLGRRDGILASHLMWVTRWLQPNGSAPLRTAYIEMVATAPEAQSRGYASALLEAFVPLAHAFDLAALCPATEGLYARLGWRFWRGPLSARKDGALISTPEERVMILALPKSPLLDVHLPLSIEWRDGEVW